MAELIANPPATTPTLLEPALIVHEGITVLAGPTKVGKTNLQLHFAWALTEGKRLWNSPFVAPEPRPVLLLENELSEAIVHRRLEALRSELAWSDEGMARFYVRCERALLLDRKDGPERILRIIDSIPDRPAVVILDSYNAAVAGDPDKSMEARRALHALRKVQEQSGVAWVITAEVRKAPAGHALRYRLDDLKGSNDLAYDADAVLMLRPLDAARRRLGVHFAAMRHLAEDAPEGLVLVRRGLAFDLTEGPGDEAEALVETVIREHVEAGNSPTWRACRDAVREARVKASNQVITDARNRVMSGPTKDVGTSSARRP